MTKRLSKEEIEEIGDLKTDPYAGVQRLIDHIEALEEEISSLKKVYEVTNQNWLKIAEEHQAMLHYLKSIGVSFARLRGIEE